MIRRPDPHAPEARIVPKHLSRWLLPTLVLAGLIATLSPSPAIAAEHQLGLGLRYWKALDDVVDEGLPDSIEDSGLAWVGSYLFDVEGPLKFAIELEYAGDGFGGSTSSAYTPQVFALVGGKLYGGVGIAMTLSSDFGGNRSDPFFVGRFGLDFALLPHLTLDINLNWQADAFNQIDHLDSDALTLAAIVRYRFKSNQ